MIYYEGKGAEKLQLESRLEHLNDSLENTQAYKIRSDKSVNVSSLNDYFIWNSFLNKKLELMLPLIESYKSRISTFAYNNIRVKVLSSIEKMRIDKYYTLRGEKADPEVSSTSSGELVNQFGLSDKDLANICDSTLNGPAAQWLEFNAPLVHEPYYYFMKLRMDAYRQKGVFFKKDKSEDPILSRHSSDFWVLLYNMGKKSIPE